VRVSSVSTRSLALALRRASLALAAQDKLLDQREGLDKLDHRGPGARKPADLSDPALFSLVDTQPGRH
jgi:hypothetical protein